MAESEFDQERKYLRQVGFSDGSTHHIVEFLFNKLEKQQKTIEGLYRSYQKLNLFKASIQRKTKEKSNK